MIYVECKPDTALVRTLGIPKREVRHVGGKGKVCNRLKNKNRCKGLIDDDPDSIQPPYLKKIKIEQLSHEIKVGKDNNNNTVIILFPKLEDWVIEGAKEAGVELNNYNLPDNPEELHRIINANIKKYVELIGELKGKSDRFKSLNALLHKK